MNENKTAQSIAEYVRMLTILERKYGVDAGLTEKTRMPDPFVVFPHEYDAFRKKGEEPDVLNLRQEMVN